MIQFFVLLLAASQEEVQSPGQRCKKGEQEPLDASLLLVPFQLQFLYLVGLAHQSQAVLQECCFKLDTGIFNGIGFLMVEYRIKGFPECSINRLVISPEAIFQPGVQDFQLDAIHVKLLFG